MFGINKKFYYILSIISLCCSILVLVLVLTNIITDNQIGYLSAIALFLISISMFLTPSSKKMKIVDRLIRNMRENFYKELEKKEPGFNIITLFENETTLSLERPDGICFEGLSFVDSLYLFKKLIKDYVIILYSVYENNKLDLKKATIASFSIVINKLDGIKEEIKIVENYAILK